MDSVLKTFGQLAADSKELARRLLTIGENRLELLIVEVQEERDRLLRCLVLVLAAAVFGLLAVMTLTATLVVVLWPYSHVAVLVTLCAIYAGATVLICWRLCGMLRNSVALPDTMDQLRKDRVCLENNLL